MYRRRPLFQGLLHRESLRDSFGGVIRGIGGANRLREAALELLLARAFDNDATVRRIVRRR